MKRLIGLLFLLCSPAFGATWYATSGSGNMSTRGYSAATTGSCTGSGATLTWASRGINDTLDLNGCTAVVIDVDPSPTPTTLTGTITLTQGSTALTGSGTNFTGQTAANDWIYIASQPAVQVSSVTDNTHIVLVKAYSGATTSGATGFDGIVTLATDTTQGGGATYATATNITMHVIISGTHTNVVAVTGSSGGGTFLGAFTAGAVGNCVQDTHTVVTVNYIGDMTGGSATGVYCTRFNGSGTFTFTGNATTGTGGTAGNPAAGLFASAGTNNMTGNCVGSDTTTGPGCNVTGTLTLTGSIINGKDGMGLQSGTVYFTPCATCYIISPKDSSYTLGTVNSHATVMPTDPGAANVKVGLAYGPNTGTLATVSSTGNW